MATELRIPDTVAEQDAQDIEDICGRVLNARESVYCSKTATTDIIVSNVFGKFVVPLCAECAAEHKEFYRARKSRRTRAYEINRHRR